MPIHPEVARRPPVPWCPAGLAPPSTVRVTLGELPSPLLTVLCSSPPASGILPGEGFDARPGSRALNLWRQWAPRKWEPNYQQIPNRPNPRNWAFMGRKCLLFQVDFIFSKELLWSELNQLPIETLEVWDFILALALPLINSAAVIASVGLSFPIVKRKSGVWQWFQNLVHNSINIYWPRTVGAFGF